MFVAESIWQEDVDPFFLNCLENSLYHSPDSTQIHAYNSQSLFPVKKKKKKETHLCFHCLWIISISIDFQWFAKKAAVKRIWPTVNKVCTKLEWMEHVWRITEWSLSWRNRDNGWIKGSLCVFCKYLISTWRDRSFQTICMLFMILCHLVLYTACWCMTAA